MRQPLHTIDTSRLCVYVCLFVSVFESVSVSLCPRLDLFPAQRFPLLPRRHFPAVSLLLLVNFVSDWYGPTSLE